MIVFDIPSVTSRNRVLEREYITPSPVLIEFAALGLCAGLLATVAAELSVYILQTRVMDMHYAPTPWIWPVGILSGALIIGGLGVFSCRKVVSTSPLTVLREL